LIDSDFEIKKRPRAFGARFIFLTIKQQNVEIQTKG